MDLIERLARAICRETCAFYGEPPCWQEDGKLSEKCNEHGCEALAMAAAEEARLAEKEVEG